MKPGSAFKPLTTVGVARIVGDQRSGGFEGGGGEKTIHHLSMLRENSSGHAAPSHRSQEQSRVLKLSQSVDVLYLDSIFLTKKETISESGLSK